MTGFKDQKNQIKNDDEEQKEEKPEQSLESYVNSVQNFKRGLIGEIIKQ
jgi:hypothetical protein